MLKRFIDIVISFLGLILVSPLFLIFILFIFLYDFKSPFYIAPRVGKNEKLFKMIKLRSMKVNADKSGVASTANNDNRITPIGKIIRKVKFDEISQLINVLTGSMSLVGPRPQVAQDVNLYTDKERILLTVRPGITDFASIVFSDEGNILEGSDDPDRDYNDLIRPWKSRLGLFYIEHQNTVLDLKLIIMTLLSFINRKRILKKISKYLKIKNADENLVNVVLRQKALTPNNPPIKKLIKKYLLLIIFFNIISSQKLIYSNPQSLLKVDNYYNFFSLRPYAANTSKGFSLKINSLYSYSSSPNLDNVGNLFSLNGHNYFTSFKIEYVGKNIVLLIEPYSLKKENKDNRVFSRGGRYTYTNEVSNIDSSPYIDKGIRESLFSYIIILLELESQTSING